MSGQNILILIKNLMNIFEKLLEIKTGKRDLDIKAIYVDKLNSEKFLSYSSYYYDKKTHTFFINWLENSNIKSRKILEEIINKAYNMELNNWNIVDILKVKKPYLYLFYYSKDNELVIIDNINLKTIRNRELKIVKLKVWMKI